MNTLYLIIALFALGAIIGMYLLAFILQKKETPKFVAFIHGIFVAAALVLLIVYNLKHPGLMESIVLFIVAALGGLVLIVRDLTGKPIPKWLAITHGLIAVAGFVFLLVAAFVK
jgi:branched-subunit amino acid transport protein AzlD